MFLLCFLLCSVKQADLASLFQSAISNSKEGPLTPTLSHTWGEGDRILDSRSGSGMTEREKEWSRNRHGHFDAFERVIAAVALGVDDLICDFHAADDFSKGRVLTIQERRIGDADEKL